jgi:hypothetical protein
MMSFLQVLDFSNGAPPPLQETCQLNTFRRQAFRSGNVRRYRPVVVATLDGDALNPIFSFLFGQVLLSWLLLLVKIVFQNFYFFNIFCSHNLFSSASKTLRMYHFANFSRRFGLILLASRCRALGSS